MTTTTHDTGPERLVEQTKSELGDAASTVQDKAVELKQEMSTAVDGNQMTELRSRPIGEIATALTRDLSLLARQELELAKAEMAEKGRVAAPGHRRDPCARRQRGRRAQLQDRRSRQGR